MPYKPRDVKAKLLRAGFFVERHEGGSHSVLRDEAGHQTYVPMHPRELKMGTFRNILKQAGLTLEEFRKL
jgi:predicted RNA binding protein YcfA (HicA-like mRNA interferase family)